MFCFLGRGHLDPAAALGRDLQSRGHEVTIFHRTIAQAAVRSEGLQFFPIDRHNPEDQPKHNTSWRRTIHALNDNAQHVLREAPAALEAARIDALIIDQMDLAAPSVAEALGIPWVTLNCAPPVCFEDPSPPLPYFPWPHSRALTTRLMNLRARAFVRHATAPVLETVNRYRTSAGLRPYRHIDDVFAGRPTITQLPRALEFPRIAQPANLFYSGPLRDTHRPKRANTFPWDRLNGKPLVYASLGTIRNDRPEVFRVILDACAALDVQLVLSLGGGKLLPKDFTSLRGDPVVVHYAPQGDLLPRASLTINCAGLNTVLDSLAHGVPLVAIPIGEDQPGVAARVEAAGVGRVEPARSLSLRRLKEAIAEVRRDGRYRESAIGMRKHLQDINAIALAAGIVERILRLPPTNRRVDCPACGLSPRQNFLGLSQNL